MKGEGARQAPPAFIDLPALLASVSDDALLANRALAALMVEYSCWDMQLAEWHGRRLPKRHDGLRLPNWRRSRRDRPSFTTATCSRMAVVSAVSS